MVRDVVGGAGSVFLQVAIDEQCTDSGILIFSGIGRDFHLLPFSEANGVGTRSR
jgi:hypothetical protein